MKDLGAPTKEEGQSQHNPLAIQGVVLYCVRGRGGISPHCALKRDKSKRRTSCVR